MQFKRLVRSMHRCAARLSSGAASAGTRLAAFVLVTGAVIFVLVSWRDPAYARLRVVGGMANPAVHHTAATFVVEAAPFSLIELRVNGHRAASAYVPWDAHQVRFERTPLDDGSNLIVARTTLWYAASRKAHTAALRLENPPAPNAPGARRPAVDRAARQAPSLQNSRALTVNLRQQELAAAFRVRLARDDRAVTALRTGRIDVAAFVDDVFGSPRFNRAPIAGFFAHARPQVVLAGASATVRADSGYRPIDLEELPALSGSVEIANAFTGPRIWVAGSGATERFDQPRPWGSDVLRVAVDDYRVANRYPAPTRTEGVTYIWERPFGAARPPVTLALVFAPYSSVDALRRGLNLPVFAFAPHVVARFLALFHGFVLAVPMFAYLALSRGRNLRFALVARRLILVAVAADVFDACISAQPDVDGEILLIAPFVRALPPSLVNLVLVPVLIGVVLAVLAWSVAALAARSGSVAGALAADAANAVRIAALGFVALAATGYAAGRVTHVPVVYPVLVAVAFAAAVLAVLFSLGWWAIPGAGRTRGAFTLATVAFAVAVAVPISLVSFGDWATVAGPAGTAFADPLSPLPLAATFIRSLAPLCPLAFGVLLIAGVRPDPAVLGLERAAFLRLVLCCYAVLAGVVVVVPLGIALAWWSYGVLGEKGAVARTRVDDPLAPTPRERGLAALPLALAFGLVDVLLLLPSEIGHLRELRTPFVVLEAAGFVAVIAASLALPAFAFAACNGELAAESPARKGLRLGLWAAACSLPAMFLRSDSLAMGVCVSLVTVVFCVVLGSVTGVPAPAASLRSPKRNPVRPLREVRS